MATEREIQSHSRLMIGFARAFSVSARPLITEIFDRLAELNSPSRTQIAQLFQPLRELANASMADLRTVLEDNLKMNQAALGAQLTAETQSLLPRLEAETLALINSAIDSEQNRIVAETVMAGLIGAAIGDTVSQLRSNTGKIVARLAVAYETGLRNFDGAVTVTQGKNRDIRYRYAGSVIAESRDFCRQMAGRVLSESQIRRIWSTQTWGGKREGDPFVTRGGWRCRHSWIPVGDEE